MRIPPRRRLGGERAPCDLRQKEPIDRLPPLLDHGQHPRGPGSKTSTLAAPAPQVRKLRSALRRIGPEMGNFRPARTGEFPTGVDKSPGIPAAGSRATLLAAWDFSGNLRSRFRWWGANTSGRCILSRVFEGPDRIGWAYQLFEHGRNEGGFAAECRPFEPWLRRSPLGWPPIRAGRRAS